MSSNIIPQEIRGLFINDKTDKFKGVGFQWKVDLTYIKRNFGFCSRSLVQLR